eukprot:TRINITY_DN13333_c0_g1_i3.p1 TRINITY_DN13333_c0_g1~~TRINITY_DN13333_c0_g1_i3.p1  ORF type:complete len:290 (-),score=68.18 TRINITY_DN13333_c0_g1_i3:108-977(-)
MRRLRRLALQSHLMACCAGVLTLGVLLATDACAASGAAAPAAESCVRGACDAETHASPLEEEETALLQHGPIVPSAAALGPRRAPLQHTAAAPGAAVAERARSALAATAAATAPAANAAEVERGGRGKKSAALEESPAWALAGGGSSSATSRATAAEAPLKTGARSSATSFAALLDNLADRLPAKLGEQEVVCQLLSVILVACFLTQLVTKICCSEMMYFLATMANQAFMLLSLVFVCASGVMSEFFGLFTPRGSDICGWCIGLSSFSLLCAAALVYEVCWQCRSRYRC